MAKGNDSMAIIRMAASAGAALIVLTTIVAAASHAQAQKAPLQLVPGPDQAKSATRAATTKTAKTVAKTSNKATRTVAPRKNARQAAVAPAQPSSKTARSNSNSKKTANTLASRRQAPSNAQRARVENGQRATRTVAAAPRPILRPAAPAPQIFAQGSEEASTTDHVMRDGDSISLVARLPWWRNDRMQEVQYGSVAAEDAVMAAAESWLAENAGEPAADRVPGQTLALASPEEVIEIADAGQVNDIDLAAEETRAPPAPTFLQSLVALLGSVAAAAAASARLLFV
jgi:hypothetical protein